MLFAHENAQFDHISSAGCAGISYLEKCRILLRFAITAVLTQVPSARPAIGPPLVYPFGSDVYRLRRHQSNNHV